VIECAYLHITGPWGSAFAHQTKATAVVTDLSDGKDSGTKKALARINRALANPGSDP
jgi:hypothetical protein